MLITNQLLVRAKRTLMVLFPPLNIKMVLSIINVRLAPFGRWSLYCFGDTVETKADIFD